MLYIKTVAKIVNLFVNKVDSFFFFTLKPTYTCTDIPLSDMKLEIDLANTCELPVHLNFPYESSTNKT